MSSQKRSKIFSRSIIVGGTILAGVGLWMPITHTGMPVISQQKNTTAAIAPSADPNFSSQDTFIGQSGTTYQLPPAVQSTPVPPAVQSVPAPAPAPAPVLRTRGS